VARRLEHTHGPRPPHETLQTWIHRLGLEAAPAAAPLQEALRLHYRLRFDPRGLADHDRLRLRHLAAELSRRDSQAR
jgi:hypothetical protein